MTKFYENTEGRLFVDPIVANHTDLAEINVQQFSTRLAEHNKPTTEQLLAHLTAERKAQEFQGVTINGIRYAGDPSNRQAISEAMQFMADSEATEFPIWKDSDDVFHVDHPLIDVVNAYRAIGSRRAQLIAAEGEYAAQVVDGSLTEVTGLTWPQ